jgi:hypothetical protein
VPVHSLAHNGASSGGNLLYHSGGSVQLGTHHTYAIYWGAANSFNSTYQTTINKYFTDVAADSGKTTNVYYSDTQYYQGTTANSIAYSENFAGNFADTTSPIPKGCNPVEGHEKWLSLAPGAATPHGVIGWRVERRHPTLEDAHVSCLPSSSPRGLSIPGYCVG